MTVGLVPVSADDDVAHEEAEQDEPVGVEEALIEPQGAHTADHLQRRGTRIEVRILYLSHYTYLVMGAPASED